jgi:hypothetical protein
MRDVGSRDETGEVDPADPVLEVRARRSCQFHCEAGLAHASRSDQREEASPPSTDQIGEFGQFAVATDETRQMNRKTTLCAGPVPVLVGHHSVPITDDDGTVGSRAVVCVPWPLLDWGTSESEGRTTVHDRPDERLADPS